MKAAKVVSKISSIVHNRVKDLEVVEVCLKERGVREVKAYDEVGSQMF